jgi:hypothetical protein
VSKVITSPSKRWKGSVTIADQLYLPQVELIEIGLEPILSNKTDSIFLTVLDKPKMPAILACVESWNLENFPNPPTVENFPMSPRKASHDLITWLFTEIRNVYIGELEIPNE